MNRQTRASCKERNVSCFKKDAHFRKVMIINIIVIIVIISLSVVNYNITGIFAVLNPINGVSRINRTLSSII